ncbi:MAG: hypothetical protein ABIQ54_04960 [Gammaproteobacteria bacterium]
MPYIQRNKQNVIIALLSEPNSEAEEKLSSSDPEVVEFLRDRGSSATSKVFLSSSDIDLVRVIEDLIDLLIDKNLILMTEFPDAAQQKLINRKSARELFNKKDGLMVEKDDIL